MIGRLRGTVEEITEDEALIDVGGVGYLVRCGARSLSRLPAIGQETVLHIESQTTEVAGTRLYGFLDRSERSVFSLLQSVQGVGPKAALSVLDVLPPAELASAIAREDKAAVGRANGVGPKLALRIVTELKGKPIGDGLVQGLSAHDMTPLKRMPSVSGEVRRRIFTTGRDRVRRSQQRQRGS
jgi:Holliday junction DNA helicase RuvA